MPANDYQQPVSELLAIGRPKGIRGKWFDYVEAYGFSQDHVPELVRLASEEDLNWQDDDECYAPIHAYRTLGQLNPNISQNSKNGSPKIGESNIETVF